MGQAFQGVASQGGQAGPRSQKRMALLSDLQFPRHLTEGAGQAKGKGSPVVPDGALEGGKERNRDRSGALLWGPRWQVPVSVPVVRGWRAPGCGSAPACRCAESAVLRAGRAHSSTPQSRQRCGRRDTAERKCRTDLDRMAEWSGPGPAVLVPREGHARWHGAARLHRAGNEGSGRTIIEKGTKTQSSRARVRVRVGWWDPRLSEDCRSVE